LHVCARGRTSTGATALGRAASYSLEAPMVARSEGV